MKVLVVGGGGREHAIIKKIKENKSVEEIFALPGNGGIAQDATCVDIAAKDIDGITKFAVDNKIDFAVVAPDDPLVLGAVDALEEKGYSFLSAEVAYVPQTMSTIDDPDMVVKMEKLIDMLEENDDVQAVWHNWEMPEE